jgi:hypothetical protein
MKNQTKSNSNNKLRTTNNSSEKSSELGDFSANCFDKVFARIMTAVGTTKAVDVANALGISQQSISGAKAKAKIPEKWLSKISDKYGVSSDWLRTGEGEMRRPEKTAAETLARMADSNAASEAFAKMPGMGAPMASANNDHDDFDFAEVMAQTIDILKSKTVYTTAIVSNIKAFHKAITTEQQIENMQGQLDQALASFASFQDQLDKTNQIVTNLQRENEQLRQELELSRAGSAISDTG